MKLGKTIRHRLFAGEIVPITFEGKCPVRRDGKYAIHTNKGVRQGQFRVLIVRRQADHWVAMAKYEGDPVRLLAIGDGYTDFDGRAVSRGDEPGPELEAVDAETQARLDKEANERWDHYMKAERPGDLAEMDARRIVHKLARMQQRAARMGVDIGPELMAALERGKERILAEADRAA